MAIPELYLNEACSSRLHYVIINAGMTTWEARKGVQSRRKSLSRIIGLSGLDMMERVMKTRG